MPAAVVLLLLAIQVLSDEVEEVYLALGITTHALVFQNVILEVGQALILSYNVGYIGLDLVVTSDKCEIDLGYCFSRAKLLKI